MDLTGEFERERPRLTRIAARVLGDPAEAEDAVQQAWLRLARTDAAAVDNLQGWLTTVVTRVCLDRLKAAVPVPVPGDAPDRPGADPDPAEEVALAESVGSALHLVLDRLSPAERVALVLHDSFAVDFATIAGILDCTPAAARKHASRARSKVAAPPGGQGTADWDVVDAFLAAARDGEFSRLLGLLAPDVVVAGDPVAVGLGTPARIEGRDAVAEF
ncbi:MAG: sigma-70 family RNA polymerase sigma factor, partial [Dietzia cercidiphylli]